MSRRMRDAWVAEKDATLRRVVPRRVGLPGALQVRDLAEAHAADAAEAEADENDPPQSSSSRSLSSARMHGAAAASRARTPASGIGGGRRGAAFIYMYCWSTINSVFSHK